jgi:hypothetical protein
VTDRPSLIEFVTDPQLMNLSLSLAQETCLRALDGLSMTSEQAEVYRLCTGRETLPTVPFAEGTIISGARGGKGSRISAPIAAYEAVAGGHERYLTRGERGIIPVVAQDVRATGIIFGYVKDAFLESPILRSHLADEPKQRTIELTNRLRIECFPCTLRSLRGWSIPAGVMDEVAFYRLEGAADSDVEIQASIRRGMVSFPRTRLIKTSTPYLQGGVLYDDFKRAWGQDDPDLLVFRAPTRLMNPTVGEARLERERRLDPVRFEREFEATFADDLIALLPAAWVERAVRVGRFELAPRKGVTYVAGVDPSGGGADEFALSVVHLEGDRQTGRVVQDVLKAQGRVGTQSPDLGSLVREYADILKRYGLREVHGDRYSGQWVRQAFRDAGITYRETDKDASQLYLDCEPLFSQGRIELLDEPKQARQWRLLERRPRAGGRDLVEHPRGQHDDRAVVLAVAASYAVRPPSAPLISFVDDARSVRRYRIEHGLAVPETPTEMKWHLERCQREDEKRRVCN